MIPAVRVPLRIPLRFDPAAVLKIHNNYNQSRSYSSLNLISRSTIAGKTSARTPTSTAWSYQRCSSLSPTLCQAYSTRTPVWYGAGNATSITNGRSSEKKEGPGSKRSKYTKYAVIGTVLGVGALVFSGKSEHLYHAVGRSGRVFVALTICINE